MNKTYSWGFFFENGEKAVLCAPFGPESPDNMISSLDDPWMLRMVELYPNLIETMDEMNLPFAFVLVNPPTESTAEELEYFKVLIDK